MKYFVFILKIEIMLIGLIMMLMNPIVSSSAFMSGSAIFTIGLYLAIEGIYHRDFTGCIFQKKAPIETKKKGLFKRL